jgi:hypothetical protein
MVPVAGPHFEVGRLGTVPLVEDLLYPVFVTLERKLARSFIQLEPAIALDFDLHRFLPLALSPEMKIGDSPAGRFDPLPQATQTGSAPRW